MKFATIALTAATLMTAASAVTAADYIQPFDELDGFASTITLEKVRSSADGVVQFESLDGDVLGMVAVTAGANHAEPVGLTGVLNQDIVAKLYHNGSDTPAAVRKIEVDLN